VTKTRISSAVRWRSLIRLPFNTYMGFGGLKNGELLSAAEVAGFEVIVTGDKTLEYEQNMKDRKIAVVSLSAPHWRLSCW